MGYKRSHDLAVTVREYEKDGETKKVREKIGSIFTDEQGRMYLRINRFFNPAGVPGESTADSILVSAFVVEDRPQGNGAPSGQTDHGRAKSNGYQPQGGGINEDDVPF